MGQPVTTNPWLIMFINMTVVFAVLYGLSLVIRLIKIIDPTKPQATPAVKTQTTTNVVAAIEDSPAEDDAQLVAVLAAAIAKYYILGGLRMKNYIITVNGQAYEVVVQEAGGSAVPAPKAAPVATLKAAPIVVPTAAPAPKAAAAAVPAGAATISAPMPGKILTVNVKPGDAVKRGAVLLILEAMKMQNEIMAPADGKVADVRIAVGQTVSTGDVMVILC